MSAREEVLARIRTALGPAPEVPPVPRAYRRSIALDPDALLDRFAERVEDYRATVHRVAADDVPAALAGLLEGRRVGVPAGLPQAWRDALDAVVDDGLAVDALDGLDGVVTACAVGVAETGTIVLDASPDQGRRALTLVPDLHACVVRADQVVASVPEALQRLDPLRPLTFISGPSATSDIELDRVEGVHGPRTLHVLLVEP